MDTKPQTLSGIIGLQSEAILFNRIEIPIIQRDYAQGRETKDINRIRKQFVLSLYNAIKGNSSPIKLDFVYGNVTDKKLIPLDGQQRLTTLFLLHWYIAKHEKISPEKSAFLQNFTYKTRFSSQHFCESLLAKEPDFSVAKLSSWIINQNWFMYSWEMDPTVKSMLVMLDEIHFVFNSEFDLWERITNENNPPVSFYFLALEEMGLTDNLYIKMNSRGKPLTEFEHFKAHFEKIIKEVSVDLHAEFIRKVDKDWVDMLWQYKGIDNVTDDEFMRYYRFITEMLCYQNNIEIVENDFDLAYSIYGKHNENATTYLRKLFNSFDCFVKIKNIDNFFDSIFSKSFYEESKVSIYTDDINLFQKCCSEYGIFVGNRRKLSLIETLLLFAVVEYLTNQDNISSEEFKERIRIVRNLAQNSPDEIRETRMQGLLLDTQNVILNAEVLTKSTGYNEIQKNEEIQKIDWRKNNLHLISELNQLEDHLLLLGSVAIVGLEDSNKFKLRASNFRRLFNNDTNYLPISKALLTIDDYSQLASWRYLFGNNNASTWRELFTISNQRKRFDITHCTLINLLDNLEENIPQFIQKTIDDYLLNNGTPKDWKYYFIKYDQMRSGKSGVYWWRNDPEHKKENPYEVFMMNTPYSTTGRHWDPFLLTLKENYDHQVRLEDYGAPLIIIKGNSSIKMTNLNIGYKIEAIDENSLEMLKNIRNLKLLNGSDIFEIKQDSNGFDIEDRIEKGMELISKII
jgi:hypothetical protein